jgi:hypothetical protein
VILPEVVKALTAAVNLGPIDGLTTVNLIRSAISPARERPRAALKPGARGLEPWDSMKSFSLCLGKPSCGMVPDRYADC